ncbi:MFS transporter [Kribbella sp. NPDC051586]|uniref:MFS transporter n=1 Tax=Kribbella sp. NPDC051586 TaxID=3364118 RepID=UPI0037A8417E
MSVQIDEQQAGQSRLGATTLAVLLTATFITAFDFFVVNVAAPSIQHELATTPAELELVVGGYAFSYASGLVLGGRLGDLLGHRLMFVLGMTCFAAASAACGLADTPGTLIWARLVQGATAAAMMPQVFGVIGRGTDAAGRSRAMAWYGAAAGAGSVVAQALGGLIVSADIWGLGWRAIFLINVPIGLVGAVAAAWALPAHGYARLPLRGQLDPFGAIGLSMGLGLVLVPLTLGRSAGWPPWTWVSMVSGPIVLALTIRWQQRYARRGGLPLLDRVVWQAPSFRIGIIASLTFMAYFGSYMFTLALLLQNGLGLSAFQAGLSFVPAGVLFSIGALVAPRLIARFRGGTVAAGGILTTTGLTALACLTAIQGPHTSVALIVVAAGVISVGNGLVMPTILGASLKDVPPPKAGVAGGTITMVQQFAGAAGVSVVGTVFFAALGQGVGISMAWSALIGVCLDVIAVAATVVNLRNRRPISPAPSDRGGTTGTR